MVGPPDWEKAQRIQRMRELGLFPEDHEAPRQPQQSPQPKPRSPVPALHRPRNWRRLCRTGGRFTGLPAVIPVPVGIRLQIQDIVTYDLVARWAFDIYQGNVPDFFVRVRPYKPSTQSAQGEGAFGRGFSSLNPWLLSVICRYAPDEASRIDVLRSVATIDAEHGSWPAETKDERHLALREALWCSGAFADYQTLFDRVGPPVQFLRDRLPSGWTCQWDRP